MGETKAGLARTNVLLIHLVGVGRKLPKRYALLWSAGKRARRRRAYRRSKKRSS